MSTDYAITEETLTNDVQHIVYDSDLRTITQRTVFQRLQDKYGILLTQFKSFIYERAVEEARIRIQSSPELQAQQAMSNPKYYYHGDINTQKQRKYFNTIYNTNTSSSAYHLSPSSSLDQNNCKKMKKQKIINYRDVKKHYIGNHNNTNNNTNNHHESSSSSDQGQEEEESSYNESDDDHDTPPLKRRRYNNMPHFNILNQERKTAQSTRENQKDIVYEFSTQFKEMMQRNSGTWRECWDWIVSYTKLNDLRISNRKIKCDLVLKKAFDREESSVSGVSRLIWKHLIGAVELDENGNFKKLVYKKRKLKKKEVLLDDEEKFKVQVQEVEKDNDNGGEIIRQKRRYRKRKRDENGEIIKKRTRSGLTRLCFMSKELIAIVGNVGPLARNKITKGFWDYTQVNGLKKPGRIIVCDEKLKKIWGEGTMEIHMYQVQKGLKEHITTMSKEDEKKYKEENAHLFVGEMDDIKDMNEINEMDECKL